MSRSNQTERFRTFSQQDVKRIAVAVKIDGLSDVLTNRPIYKKVKYGDPGIFYGTPDLVYGGRIAIDSAKPYLSWEGSSSTISQKIEPESGKSSVSQLSLAFTDVDEYMTRVISPGVVLDEILGREIEVFLGYEELFYPEDYVRVFRGYITGTTSQSGRVTLTISDPNFKRRQELFLPAKTSLLHPITDSDFVIGLTSTNGLPEEIKGPDNTYDTAITPYMKIGDEILGYDPDGILSDTVIESYDRGQRGTVAEAHDAADEVTSAVQIDDNPVTMALKLMLSGWAGPWKEGVATTEFSIASDPYLAGHYNAILLAPGIDAIRDFGLVDGDWIIAENPPVGSVSGQLTRIGDYGTEKNRVIYTMDGAPEWNRDGGTVAFRSKYDTYPTTCGLKLTPRDVDVARHEYYRNTFLFQPENRMRFLITDAESSGKGFIESQLLRPMGAYSVTREGKLSMGITKPPLADERLQTLSTANLMNVEGIAVKRSTSNRTFYNQVSYDYDFSDDGTAASLLRVLDSESLTKIGITSNLPIEARGARTDLQVQAVLEKRANLILSRFKRGAVSFDVSVTWDVASQVEAGDVVALDDSGKLFISNLATGERDIGIQLFEVVDRTLDMKSGSAKLTLVSGVGGEASDRFGTVSPSSIVSSGSTASAVIIQDSYSIPYPGDEKRKWEDYIGQNVLVHTEDWSSSDEVRLLGFDTVNPYQMNVEPLSFTPTAGCIVDVPLYPTASDTLTNRIYKLLYAFQSPQVAVVSGASDTEFDVSVPDSALFRAGAYIRVHSYDFTDDSGDLKVASVASQTITASTPIGFTPDSSHLVDLIGFADAGAPYRLI